MSATRTTRNVRGRTTFAPPPVTRQNTRRRTEAPSLALENAEATASAVPSPREEMPSHALENAEPLFSPLPSPRGEEILMPDENAEHQMPTSVMPPPYGETIDPDEQRASTDVEDSSDDPSKVDRQSDSERGRAHSLDSARTSLKNKNKSYSKSKTLSTEQEKVVEAASNLLTQEQMENIQRRQIRVE